MGAQNVMFGAGVLGSGPVCWLRRFHRDRHPVHCACPDSFLMTGGSG